MDTMGGDNGSRKRKKENGKVINGDWGGSGVTE